MSCFRSLKPARPAVGFKTAFVKGAAIGLIRVSTRSSREFGRGYLRNAEIDLGTLAVAKEPRH
jgi:hypothetical protein